MSRQYDMEEEGARFALCEICDSDIIIDFYSEVGDTVSCDDCGAYYILQSISPLRISPIESEDGEAWADLDFGD